MNTFKQAHRIFPLLRLAAVLVGLIAAVAVSAHDLTQPAHQSSLALARRSCWPQFRVCAGRRKRFRPRYLASQDVFPHTAKVFPNHREAALRSIPQPIIIFP